MRSVMLFDSESAIYSDEYIVITKKDFLLMKAVVRAATEYVREEEPINEVAYRLSKSVVNFNKKVKYE